MIGPSEIAVLLIVLLIVIILARYRTKRICPNCGFAIQTYVHQCPECGMKFPRRTDGDPPSPTNPGRVQ